jgi:chitin synthase
VKVSKVGGKDVIEFDMPSDKNDINAYYDRHIAALKMPRPDEKKHRDAKTKQEDYFKSFRTRFVLTWMLSNGLLMAALTNDFVRGQLYSGVGISATSNLNPFLIVSLFFYFVLYNLWFSLD